MSTDNTKRFARIQRTPEGILIEIEEVQHKKHWRTKPLTRLCDLMRVAIALLGVLSELLDWL